MIVLSHCLYSVADVSSGNTMAICFTKSALRSTDGRYVLYCNVNLYILYMF